MPAYDYSTPGAYFVTTCVQDRQPIFADEKMRDLATKTWTWLAGRFPNVELDELVFMPDHIHFIVWLLDGTDGRGGHPAAQGAQPRAPTLANVVGAFKTVVARSINATRGTPGERLWQRN